MEKIIKIDNIKSLLMLVVTPVVICDTSSKLVTMKSNNLDIRLNYNNRCVIESVKVKGKEVVNGVYSSIKRNRKWLGTNQQITSPTVETHENKVIVKNINFGDNKVKVNESWNFVVDSNTITWEIIRTYDKDSVIKDTYFAGWDFSSTDTWDGALLGNGGVAWFKLFNTDLATYGIKTANVTFWNKRDNTCLKMLATSPTDHQVAVKFTKQPSGILTMSHSVTEEELGHKYYHRRYLKDATDIWKKFRATAGTTIKLQYIISVLDYDEEYDKGNIVYFDESLIREMLNTIARIGVIDTKLMGTNSWWTSYGPICLHEPWIVLMGMAIDDDNYTANLKDTLDYYRDNAVLDNGRVKARWSYEPGDDMYGTYDKNGFYETTWGYLMDSNPDFVINVAELFNLTGDLKWVKNHKDKCELALNYLLNRDSDKDFLAEMKNTHSGQNKGSDWIDIIWASYENALVNAKLYHALKLWADVEELLKDSIHARTYNDFADNLKNNFNKSTSEGGFWDKEKGWFVHWRNKDNSIHGNNFVLPVNFTAIAYGLVDTFRRKEILEKLEPLMEKEKLFSWPLCIYSYADGEGHPSTNFPFPKYENGDIFLSWAESGVAAYKDFDPSVGIKYIKNVIDKYSYDGLVTQRYLRKTQSGSTEFSGEDILAGNAMAIIGLYYHVYGIQPKHNRLYLDPHITDKLDGTRLKYSLRNEDYIITLNTNNYTVGINNFELMDKESFGIDSQANSIKYFNKDKDEFSMFITRSTEDFLEIRIESWGKNNRAYKKWSEFSRNRPMTVHHIIKDLKPGSLTNIYVDDKLHRSCLSDSTGRITFSYNIGYGRPRVFEVK